MNEFVQNIACNEKLWRKTDHWRLCKQQRCRQTIRRLHIGLSRVNFCNGYSFAHDDDSVDTAVILIEIVRDDYSIVATRAACLLSVFIIASLTR